MILIDTGPLVAVGDRSQINTKCIELFDRYSSELITTLPCLTEAMYLSHRFAGKDKGLCGIWY